MQTVEPRRPTGDTGQNPPGLLFEGNYDQEYKIGVLGLEKGQDLGIQHAAESPQGAADRLRLRRITAARCLCGKAIVAHR